MGGPKIPDNWAYNAKKVETFIEKMPKSATGGRTEPVAEQSGPCGILFAEREGKTK